MQRGGEGGQSHRETQRERKRPSPWATAGGARWRRVRGRKDNGDRKESVKAPQSPKRLEHRHLQEERQRKRERVTAREVKISSERETEKARKETNIIERLTQRQDPGKRRTDQQRKKDRERTQRNRERTHSERPKRREGDGTRRQDQQSFRETDSRRGGRKTKTCIPREVTSRQRVQK